MERGRRLRDQAARQHDAIAEGNRQARKAGVGAELSGCAIAYNS